MSKLEPIFVVTYQGCIMIEHSVEHGHQQPVASFSDETARKIVANDLADGVAEYHPAAECVSRERVRAKVENWTQRLELLRQHEGYNVDTDAQIKRLETCLWELKELLK